MCSSDLMRLLPDKGTPAMVAKGFVKPISRFRVKSNANRSTNATAKPSKRARGCWVAGNSEATMAMKTRLSMPKTIYIAVNATNAANASVIVPTPRTQKVNRLKRPSCHGG